MPFIASRPTNSGPCMSPCPRKKLAINVQVRALVALLLREFVAQGIRLWRGTLFGALLLKTPLPLQERF
jgi:hypothetical protein